MEIIPRTQQLFLFGYQVEVFGQDAGVPAIELLFTAFQELRNVSSSPEFVVWIGSCGDEYWWIGVPSSLPNEVTDLLRDYLSGPVSFKTMELGELPEMGLLPKWKFTHEAIYALADIAGGDDISTSAYGTDLKVEVLPCMVPDEAG